MNQDKKSKEEKKAKRQEFWNKTKDFIKDKAPHLVNIVADFVPGGEGISNLISSISRDVNTPENIKEEIIQRLNYELELAKLDNENTADARDLQKEALKQEDIFSKRFNYYLASFWSIIGGVYIFFVTFAPVRNERFADIVIGFLLGTIVATIINFFFGSSTGSKEKLNELLKIKSKEE